MVRFSVVALLGLVAMACGGSAAPATEAIPTPTTVVGVAAGDLDAEAALRERVEAALALASRGEWLAAYEFYTLSFRDNCPGETFAAQATSGMNLFRGMLGLPLDGPLEFRLMSVTVIGATALVSVQIFHQGEPLEYGAQDELDSWVLIDGEWWNNVPPGPQGCVN